jgi:hypothetical protein
MREMDLHSLRMHLDTLYPTVANDLEDNDDDDYKSVQGGTLVGPDNSFDMFESWIVGGAEIYDLNPDILDSPDSEPMTSEFIEHGNTDTDMDIDMDDTISTVYSSEFIEGGAASDVDDALKTLGTLDTTPVVSGPQISLIVPIGSVTDTNMNNLKNENFKTNILNLLNNIIL